MSLSIVIPAFEEAHKIARDVNAATSFLKEHCIAGEVIIVDDGSNDDTAAAALRAMPVDGIPCRVIRLETNRGKGHAVRTGIGEAACEYVMFADSGSCVPLDNVLHGIEMIAKGECDIAHGSRKMPGCRINRPQSRWRRMCSKAFQFIVHTWLKLPANLTDTQCGFKVYRADVGKNLYSQAVTDGFTFDVEIIARAQRCGYRIKEFPVEWTCDCDSRISLRRTSLRVFRELVKIKRVLNK